MDIKNFPKEGSVEREGWGLVDYFLTYYDIISSSNNKNITYQQFYCCLRYIFYTYFIFLCFDVILPFPEKLTFGSKKCVFSHSFSSPRRLKQTSLYR